MQTPSIDGFTSRKLQANKFIAIFAIMAADIVLI